MVDTDKEWEHWGSKDPYYGVVTDPAFRKDAMDAAAKQRFFQTGEDYISYVFEKLRSDFNYQGTPARALDFGSGVGRLAIPLSRRCRQVTGVEISESMIREARQNASEQGAANIDYVLADDQLSRVTGSFDFINSYIVMQHIPVERGVSVFQGLVERLDKGGFGAIHMTYAYYWYYDRTGLPPLLTRRQKVEQMVVEFRKKLGLKVERHKNFGDGDPEMMMYNYCMNQPLYVLQRAGIKKVNMDFTDHGGAWGVTLFFQKP